MNKTKIYRRVSMTIFQILFLAITLIWVYPLLWTVSSSLKSNLEIFNGSISLLPGAFHWSMLNPANWGKLDGIFQLDNYRHAWYTADFKHYFSNTLIFAVSVTLIVLVLCAMTGYALGRYHFPGKKLFVACIGATMFIPSGYTIIPVWKIINSLGLQSSQFGVILAEAGTVHVLYILLFMAYFAGVPKELADAAHVDGAGFFRTFAVVMLPLAKPVVATTCIMQFIHSWNSFLIPLVFTIHRPGLRTLGVAMYNFIGQESFDVAGMAAGATISFVPIIIVFVFFQRYFVEGIAGAIKG